MLKKLIVAAAVAALSAPAFAADVAVGQQVGTDEAAIRAALTAEGYDVRKFDSEDGEIEVYAVKDGRKLEIYVSPATGAVEKIKEES